MDNNIQKNINVFKKLLISVEWSNIPKTAYIYIILALCITILGIILIIYDIIRLIIYSNKRRNIDNPLLIDTLEYNVIYSTRFFKFTKFNMWLYLIIPFISLIFVGLTYLIITDYDNLSNTNKLILLLGGYNLFVFLVYLNSFLSANKKFNYVKERLNKANSFICSNIYKNPITLKQLTLKEDTYLLDETIKNILQDIPIDIKPNDLAKLYYTLHLYSHLHKIGIYDIRTKEAIDKFKPLNIVIKCSFIEYFYRYGTFIENINNTLSEYTPKNIPNKVVTSALSKCYSNISETNILANSIHIEYVLSPFNKLFITSAIIQILPLLILYLYTYLSK